MRIPLKIPICLRLWNRQIGTCSKFNGTKCTSERCLVQYYRSVLEGVEKKAGKFGWTYCAPSSFWSASGFPASWAEVQTFILVHSIALTSFEVICKQFKEHVEIWHVKFSTMTLDGETHYLLLTAHHEIRGCDTYQAGCCSNRCISSDQCGEQVCTPTHKWVWLTNSVSYIRTTFIHAW